MLFSFSLLTSTLKILIPSSCFSFTPSIHPSFLPAFLFSSFIFLILVGFSSFYSLVLFLCFPYSFYLLPRFLGGRGFLVLSFFIRFFHHFDSFFISSLLFSLPTSFFVYIPSFIFFHPFFFLLFYFSFFHSFFFVLFFPFSSFTFVFIYFCFSFQSFFRYSFSIPSFPPPFPRPSFIFSFLSSIILSILPLLLSLLTSTTFYPSLFSLLHSFLFPPFFLLLSFTVSIIFPLSSFVHFSISLGVFFPFLE